jgi:hypothetical protein
MEEKAPKKMYFDEKSFQELLVEYQKSAVIYNGVVIKKNEVVERELVEQVQKIVMAIINQYKYSIFEDIDDLRQEGLRACFTNFMKFHPDKGTAFNYFSIIVKIHLLNYTDRRKKHRNLSDIEECLDVEGQKELNYDLFFENLELTLFRIIDENFVGNRRKKYTKIAAVIIGFLRKSKVYTSKSDMYSWLRSYGYKSGEAREFIKAMSKFYPDLISVIGD